MSRHWRHWHIPLPVACTYSGRVFGSPGDGFYNDSSLVWLNPLETGETDQQSQRLRIGANGQLLEPVEAAARGYNMEVFGSQVQVTIPFDAVGGYKKVGRTVLSLAGALDSSMLHPGDALACCTFRALCSTTSTASTTSSICTLRISSLT